MKYEINKTPEFEKWLCSKKIKAFKVRILGRLERIKNGNFGDAKSLGNGLFELRFTFGDGIRIYYTIENKQVVFVLAGGTKSSQSSDINKTKQMLKD